MTREKELIIIFKDNLAEMTSAIDKNQYSSDTSKITKSIEGCLILAKEMKEYYEEYITLKTLTDGE
jgi:hypothetical protein